MAKADQVPKVNYQNILESVLKSPASKTSTTSKWQIN